MIKHVDLFSGIGGFALAVDTIWPGAEHIFCDNDKFCQQVLKKHWPNSKIHGDIRTLTTNTDKLRHVHSEPQEQSTERPHKTLGQSVASFKSPFILTGGFPCQPFSQAGSRKGTADNRYLWPEMLRVIREFSPLWIVGENVGGLVTWNDGMVLRQVYADLEEQGYEVQAFVIPAVAVNAPHRRDRIWIIANSKGAGRRGGGRVRTGRTDNEKEWSTSWSENQRRNWNRNWLEVATEFCRVDNGLSAELDGFKLTKPQHRIQRLKALGNAIVPQVAIEIMKAIKQANA